MSRNFLSEILAQKREAVARMKARPFSDRLRERALEIRKTAVQHRLLQALVGTPRCGVRSAQRADPTLKIIAEFKRMSPSAGIIRDDRSAEELARSYERGGACAISVLTDEAYFGGSIADLRAVRVRYESADPSQRFCYRSDPDLRNGNRNRRRRCIVDRQPHSTTMC